MKKTVSVNLNSRVFIMDEDAYQLLDKYLQNLRIHFRKEEGGDEIVADFEARIEELFSEKTRLGYEVISIGYVEEVIARVGKPGDFSEDGDAKEESETHSQRKKSEKGLYRDGEDKAIGGFCSGLATYFGWDVLAVRVIFIVLLFVSFFWMAVVYVIAWIVVPEAKTAEEKLRMKGEPVTIENIGKTVSGATKKVSESSSGCLGSLVSIVGVMLKVCLIGLACLVAVPVLFGLFIAIVVLVSVLFGVGGGLLGTLPFGLGNSDLFVDPTNPILGVISFILLVIIPLIAFVYWIVARITKLKPLNKGVKWAGIVIWILALLSFIYSGLKLTDVALRNNHWDWSVSLGGRDLIEGNGIVAERSDSIVFPVDRIKLTSRLAANLQVEQTSRSNTLINITGDENLIDKISYKLDGNTLRLAVLDGYNIKSGNNIFIVVKTPLLKGLELNSIGKVKINGPFYADNFELELDGAGMIEASGLNVRLLKATAEGVGSVILGGTAGIARFELEGAGRINAYDLLADSVYSKLEGVGVIDCNPVEYLDAHVNGVGKIKYKSEPKSTKKKVVGIGVIDRN